MRLGKDIHMGWEEETWAYWRLPPLGPWASSVLSA